MSNSAKKLDYKAGKTAGQKWVHDKNWGANPVSIRSLADSAEVWPEWFGRDMNAAQAESV